MSYSGDAAEQVVRMTLEGAEFAAKIAGAGAKQVAVLLYAILRDQKKTKGKTRLTNMLRSGKELKVFAVKDADLQRFCMEAKKYGVLYCVLKDKSATDGLTDIMVRAEDAGKINRIFERFDLATVDLASVKEEIQRQQAEKAGEGRAEEPEAPAVGQQEKEDAFLDELLAPPQDTPAKEGEQPTNPTAAREETSNQSAPISKPKEQTGPGISEDTPQRGRPSVRQELKEIREEQRQKTAAKNRPAPQHKAPGKKKSRRSKGKGR